MNRSKVATPGRSTIRFTVLCMVAFLAGAVSLTRAGVPPRADSRGPVGDAAKADTIDGTLLVDSFETLMKDRDEDAFRKRVEARYSEESLTRILSNSPDVKARRAAALASGMWATFQVSNAGVAKGLRDNDQAVRLLTQSSLWAIWFRASTPENNKAILEVTRLIGERELDQAIEKATKLIEKAPDFAEAYNQRAIAHYMKGELAESVEDCRKVLERNPYHFGALTGMAGCYRGLGQLRRVLSALRQAQRVCPHDRGIAESIRAVEEELGSDSGKANSKGIDA